MPAPPITTTQAQSSIKNIWKESFSLNPSTMIHLYIIDLTNILIDNNLQHKFSKSRFFFHNNVRFLNTSIFWDEDRDSVAEEFIAAPISMTDFEITSRGVLPTPKMSITVSEAGIDTLALLREEIYSIGDLVGSKVIRIRTFAKFLPTENKLDLIMNDEWAPDPNSEFPRDEFFIERMANSDRLNITYELSSVLDLENLKLPKRQVIANTCQWTFRGHGCLYEYKGLRIESEHGKAADSTSGLPYEISEMPTTAPPVANDRDELIFGGPESILKTNAFIHLGPWQNNVPYILGNCVWIIKNNIRYHFACKVPNTNVPPPNSAYWQSDLCSKTVKGCSLRFGINSPADFSNTSLVKGRLPIGAFPSVNRLNNR